VTIEGTLTARDDVIGGGKSLKGIRMAGCKSAWAILGLAGLASGAASGMLQTSTPIIRLLVTSKNFPYNQRKNG
jgi:hypothetical protein